MRLLALGALARFGPRVSDEPPGAVVAALNDRSAEVRMAAGTALSRFPCPLDPWLGLLVQRLEQEEPQVAFWSKLHLQAESASGILGSRDTRPCVGPEESRPDCPLQCRLSPRTARGRPSRQCGPHTRPSGRVLRDPIGPGPDERLARENFMTMHAARMLGRIAPGTPSAGEVIAALTGAVESAEQAQWQSATEALVQFGPAAEPAIPAFIRNVRTASRNEDPIIHLKGQMAAESLAKIALGTKWAGEAMAA